MKELSLRDYDVLVVDDERDNLEAFRLAFRRTHRVHLALGGAEALAMLATLDAAVVVSDQRMPEMTGVELLREAKRVRPDCAGVLLTAYAELDVLIDAVNSGAVDRYIPKPWDQKELAAVLRQCVQSFATVRENRLLREQLEQYTSYLEREGRDPIDFGELDVPSEAMRAVSDAIATVAPTPTHVLVLAPEGGEQEVVARSIHVSSPREAKPFVRVPCAAFDETGLERELFGWRAGAFAGAFEDRAGRVELAHGGTLFLHGLESLSAALQHRLLRLVQRGEAERVGDTAARRVDLRLVVSSSEASLARWRAGAIAAELVHALSVFPLRLPPLSERPGDVPALATHFVAKYRARSGLAQLGLSAEALALLSAHALPGNARELEAVVERACVWARGHEVRPEHLAFLKAAILPEGASTRPPRALDAQLDDVERRELLAALERCGGNKAEVARLLGVQRTTLYYRLKRLGIQA